MSLAIDAIDDLIDAWRTEVKDVPHNIREIDNAIGLKYEHLQQARVAIMKAEAKAMEACSPRMRIHTLRETCLVCGHPEYCPKYGSR
jgi:hypothetical protein